MAEAFQSGAGAAALPAAVAEALALVRPGDPDHAGYPLSEAEYWRGAHAQEPYYEAGRRFEDYSTAYELGWVSYHRYGGEFDTADRVLGNDWLVRKGISTLSWEQARPAARAAWQRAENARCYATDGSADAAQVHAALEGLYESARDGELGFRDGVAHAREPELAQWLERLAQQCGEWATRWQSEIGSRGGAAAESGTVAAAAQRAWLQIRSLFGGASDETLLAQCERGQDEVLARCREALCANLPRDLHDQVQRQFEQAQRHRDHLRRLRERAAALATDEAPLPQ